MIVIWKHCDYFWEPAACLSIPAVVCCCAWLLDKGCMFRNTRLFMFVSSPSWPYFLFIMSHLHNTCHYWHLYFLPLAHLFVYSDLPPSRSYKFSEFLKLKSIIYSSNKTWAVRTHPPPRRASSAVCFYCYYFSLWKYIFSSHGNKAKTGSYS